jgi:hypothetical protein
MKVAPILSARRTDLVVRTVYLGKDESAGTLVEGLRPISNSDSRVPLALSLPNENAVEQHRELRPRVLLEARPSNCPQLLIGKS